MPMVTQQEGYPVNAERAAAATVEKSETPVAAAESTPLKGKAKTLAPTGGTQPTLKDRSIINQTAWKVAAMMSNSLVQYNGSKEALKAAVLEIKTEAEKDMLSVYGGE